MFKEITTRLIFNLTELHFFGYRSILIMQINNYVHDGYDKGGGEMNLKLHLLPINCIFLLMGKGKSNIENVHFVFCSAQNLHTYIMKIHKSVCSSALKLQ